MSRLIATLLVAAAVAVLAGCGSTSGLGAPAQGAQQAGNCDPNYAGACLAPDSSDYDCAGGSGNGPDYTGTVQVVGGDPHGLDRDGDGVACEG